MVEIREGLTKKDYVPIYWNDDTVFVDNLDKILYNESQIEESGSDKNANLDRIKTNSDISKISTREGFISNNKSNTSGNIRNEQGETTNLYREVNEYSKQRNSENTRSEKNIGTNQGLEESSSFNLQKIEVKLQLRVKANLVKRLTKKILLL